MNDRRAPSHMRRAKRARQAQFVLGLAAAAFVIYRIVAVFLQ